MFKAKMPPPFALTNAPANSSPLSSPDSFVTATASPPKPADATVTDISSPGEAEADHGYRMLRQLPFEIKQHCQVYLEEGLHSIGLNFLRSFTAAGGSSINARRGTYCPPPNQIAFLNNAIIHPDFTTRPPKSTFLEVAADSLVYLRDLLHTVGPVNGRFKEAFRFSSRWSRNGSPASDSENEILDDAWGDLQLSGKYARESIWRKGLDFFNVVGWAFNCSVLYPNRWEHWRLWLEFMLDLLEADLEERHRLDEEAHHRTGGEEGKCEFPLLRDSILAGYVTQRSGRGSGGVKGLMKAIFADGNASCSSIFQELWHKEHKGVSKMNNALHKRKRDVNLEKGDYGSYMDDESVYSSQASEQPTPQKKGSGSTGKYQFEPLEPAFAESIALRQRLFALLSYLCHYLPDPPIEMPELYESYEASVKPLSLPIFSAFILGATSNLRDDSQVSILQDLLELFMPTSAKSPSKVDADRYDANGTSPAILEQCFLPYAANTLAAEDNAKVSLLLEELVKLVWVDVTEEFSSELAHVVKKGVDARDAKANRKTSRGGRGGGKDESDVEARATLAESGRRLKMMVTLMEEEAESADKKYCFCQEVAHDDMIACGNKECQYKWFHWKCVGRESEPEGNWLCSECAESEEDEDSMMEHDEDTIEVSFMSAQSS